MRRRTGNANDCMETRLSKAPRQQKQKVFFLICSRSRVAKLLVHFFTVSAFLIPNLMGTYTTELSRQVF